LSDSSDVQEAAARLLGEHLRVNRVGYAEIEGGQYIIRREYARGVAPLVAQGPVRAFGVALVDAYRRGDTVVVNDVRTDPRFAESERTALQAGQTAAFIGVTLLKGGRVIAGFGAGNSTPRLWKTVEIELVRDVAERTWDARNGPDIGPLRPFGTERSSWNTGRLS
jgi:GAF domain-containing protein